MKRLLFPVLVAAVMAAGCSFQTAGEEVSAEELSLRAWCEVAVRELRFVEVILLLLFTGALAAEIGDTKFCHGAFSLGRGDGEPDASVGVGLIVGGRLDLRASQRFRGVGAIWRYTGNGYGLRHRPLSEGV